MAKTLLFFQGIYDTIDLFVEAFAEAFRELGCTCHVLDVRDQGSLLCRLANIVEGEGLDGVVTFNNIGYNLSLEGEGSLWERKGIPYYNILMDHPFHYAHPLEHAPGTSVVFCTDRNHVAFLRRFYPHLKQVDFFPHAGMEADLTEYADAGRCHLCFRGDAFHPCMEERPIDVLYAGGLSKYVAEGLVPDLGEITEFDAFALTKETLLYLMSHPNQTTEGAIEDYLRSIGKTYSDRELNRWITKLRFLDSYATSYYREWAVRVLVESGVKVTVFGGGWDRCEWAGHPNLVYGGKVLAPQVLELMNHAKIVLNTMTWYKNGMHDRVINGMLAKAAVVTDSSEYLTDAFPDLESCLAPFELTKMQAFPEAVHGLLGNLEKLSEIAECGYRAAKTRHTFLQRARFLYDSYLT